MRWRGARAGAAWAVLAAAALGACRCDDPGSTLTRSPAGFRLDTDVVNFGKVRVGESTTRAVLVTSTAPYTQALRVAATAPFWVDGPLPALEPAATVELRLRFTATPGDHTGTVVVATEEVAQRITVTGRGVTPLACLPTAPCRVSGFDLESERCIESVAGDGELCDPEDVCEVDGLCEAGTCRGRPRSCDDNNACTLDGACVRGLGCLNRPRSCPGSDNPCLVPACNPNSGCTLVAAPGQPCGPFESCAKIHLCSPQATCEPQPAPDGFPCSPPTPCREAGTCQQQQCVEPDAGTLAPTLALPLEAAPAGDAGEPILFAHEGNLFAIVCAAGEDAGCGLRGWTGNLLQLFSAPFEDARERAIAAIAPEGIWLRVDGGVEQRDLHSGALRLEVATAGNTTPHAQALTSSGEWVGLVVATTDAGAASSVTTVAPDGGIAVFALEGDWTDAEVALAADDAVWAWRADGTVSRLVPSEDGGARAGPVATSDAGRGLILGPDHLLAGGRTVIRLDGGAEVGTLNAVINGVPAVVETEPALLTRDGAFVLLRSCAPLAEGCGAEEESLWIRRFDPATATPLWTAPVLRGEDDGFVAELLSLDGGVGLVMQRFDGGAGEVWLHGYRDGDALLSCALEGEAVLGGVVFESEWMYALLRRDAGWTLEGFDLTGAPVDTSGWPARHGVSGTRRARR